MNSGKLFENLNIFLYLNRLLKNFPFDSKHIASIQLQKLQKLVVHAYRNFNFYKQLMDNAGFDPYSLNSIEDLEKLPIIEKEMYREFTYSIVKGNPSFYSSKFHIDGTSGSTGIPLKIYRSWKERAMIKAGLLRGLRLNGYRIFDRTFWIVSPHRLLKRDSFFQKLGIMPRDNVSYLDTPENMYKCYMKSNPDILIANKSQLVQLSLTIKRVGVDIKKPKITVCGAETLDANSRMLIQEIFGEETLVEIYGAIECGILGFGLKKEGFLHPSLDTHIIELDNDGTVNKTRGNCIVTALDIFSFPLIRYRLGDWIEMEEFKGYPIIKSILGRMDDWITWKDGARIPFHFFYEVMERRVEIRQFRIIQENYDLIRILIVLRSNVSEEQVKKILYHELKSEINAEVTYEIEFVESISPDPTGKLRMVVSRISN
jgi:phenylacetate-CoA ligase